VVVLVVVVVVVVAVVVGKCLQIYLRLVIIAFFSCVRKRLVFKCWQKVILFHSHKEVIAFIEGLEPSPYFDSAMVSLDNIDICNISLLWR
jgi:hypothetical protein